MRSARRSPAARRPPPGRPAAGRTRTAPARPARRSGWPAASPSPTATSPKPGARTSTGTCSLRRPSRAVNFTPARSPSARRCRARAAPSPAGPADVLVVDEELHALTSSSVSGLLIGLHHGGRADLRDERGVRAARPSPGGPCRRARPAAGPAAGRGVRPAVADHQVRGEVAGGPAGAQRGRVRPDCEQQIGELRAFPARIVGHRGIVGRASDEPLDVWPWPQVIGCDAGGGSAGWIRPERRRALRQGGICRPRWPAGTCSAGACGCSGAPSGPSRGCSSSARSAAACSACWSSPTRTSWAP